MVPMYDARGSVVPLRQKRLNSRPKVQKSKFVWEMGMRKLVDFISRRALRGAEEKNKYCLDFFLNFAKMTIFWPRTLSFKPGQTSIVLSILVR